jgi:hypothetical protein
MTADRYGASGNPQNPVALVAALTCSHAVKASAGPEPTHCVKELSCRAVHMSDQTTNEQISRKPTAAELFQVWFIFIIFLSAILAFWLPRLFGFQFLGSQIYYEDNRIIANIFGGIVFIFCIYILWIECFFEKSKSWGNKNAPSGLKLLF